jgi:hypothetical protein
MHSTSRDRFLTCVGSEVVTYIIKLMQLSPACLLEDPDYQVGSITHLLL